MKPYNINCWQTRALSRAPNNQPPMRTHKDRNYRPTPVTIYYSSPTPAPFIIRHCGTGQCREMTLSTRPPQEYISKKEEAAAAIALQKQHSGRAEILAAAGGELAGPERAAAARGLPHAVITARPCPAHPHAGPTAQRTALLEPRPQGRTAEEWRPTAGREKRRLCLDAWRPGGSGARPAGGLCRKFFSHRNAGGPRRMGLCVYVYLYARATWAARPMRC